MKQTYIRAQALCQQVGETLQIFPVLSGLVFFQLVEAKLQTARELAEQFLDLALRQDESGLLLQARGALGIPLFFLV